MVLPPDAGTLGLRSTRPVQIPPPDRPSRQPTSPQAVIPLGGQEPGSQDGRIHQPPQSTTTNTQQPPAYPASTYQLDLPDVTTQTLPVVHPTSYLRTRLDHTIQGSRDLRAAVNTLPRTSQDHIIAPDGQGSRNLTATANPSENSERGVPLGLSNRGHADSRAAAQHRPRQRQRTPTVRIAVCSVQTRGRGIPRGSSHRGHANSRAATQRPVSRNHPPERANISRPVTRGTRRGWGPGIPRTPQVLVREGELEEMVQFISTVREGGRSLSVAVLQREGWVVSSITLQIDARQVDHVRVVYRRTVDSRRDRAESVSTAEGGEEEASEGGT